MKAVITVVGKDKTGILADISTVCSQEKANIIEVTQSVLQDMFCMIMLVDISSAEFDKLSSKLKEVETKQNLKIHVMHEDIFNSMHRI
ncbi:MAG: ACT domain-containing protein [Oscillospiraceae bacterium]